MYTLQTLQIIQDLEYIFCSLVSGVLFSPFTPMGKKREYMYVIDSATDAIYYYFHV